MQICDHVQILFYCVFAGEFWLFFYKACEIPNLLGVFAGFYSFDEDAPSCGKVAGGDGF